MSVLGKLLMVQITVSNLWEQVQQRIENIGLAAVSPLVDLP
jgi:hypothetical protein